MALLGRKREWIRYQGRANAALLLLARAMGADFDEPAQEKEFAVVQGRARGCTFVLRVVEAAGAHELHLTVRHFHTQRTASLEGPGCVVPDLDPDQLRAAIEAACHDFATNH